MDEYYDNICCAFCNRVYSMKHKQGNDIKFNSIHVKECANKDKIPEGYTCFAYISFSAEPKGKVINIGG